MMPFRHQIIGHVCVGFAVGFLLNLAFTPAETVIEQKATPFVTQHDMLAVSLVLHIDAPPEIVSIQPLSQGRLSVVQSGEYTLTLQDAQDIPIYAISFRVLFLQPGDPPLPADTVRMTLVVPNAPEVHQVVITSPQGSAMFDLVE